MPSPLPKTVAELERWCTAGLIAPGWETSAIDDYLADLLAGLREQASAERTAYLLRGREA